VPKALSLYGCDAFLVRLFFNKQAIEDAAAAAAVSQRKVDALKASRGRRKALAHQGAAADELARRLAVAEEGAEQQRADAAAAADALAQVAPLVDLALPAPHEEWDLGSLLGDALSAAEGVASPTSRTAVSSELGDASRGAAAPERRSADGVRARLLEVWARPLHAAKRRPRHERLARHLLDK
jgi:hypothetical protein